MTDYCHCGIENCKGGVFPECGCGYTTDDDGIHFCPLHLAAPELLEACKEALKRGQFSFNGLTDKERVNEVLEKLIASAEGKQNKP